MPLPESDLHKKIRVMLVDDSVVVRGLLRRIVEKNPRLDIVMSAGDGRMAVDAYAKHRPDVVLMDIEMPEMDGITALRAIIGQDADARVIMCSSCVVPGSEMAATAFKAGALECLLKPSSVDIDRGEKFETLLLRAVHLFAKGGGDMPAADVAISQTSSRRPDAGALSAIPLQPYPPLQNGFSAVAIGASTGGPVALQSFLAALQPDDVAGVPLFVTQHILANFSATLADTLASVSKVPVHLAADGMVVEKGHVYIAPGGAHLTVSKDHPCRIRLSDQPPVNFCKPSIDVMLSSLAEHYGGRILTVFFTGMGMDGYAGVKYLQETSKNNVVLAQDQESSIVWGIPGAIAKAGLCHAVLPLSKLPAAVCSLLKGVTPPEGKTS